MELDRCVFQVAIKMSALMVCGDGFEDDAVGLKQLQCVHLKFARVIIAAKQKQSEWNKFGRDEVEGDEKENTEDERLIHQNGACQNSRKPVPLASCLVPTLPIHC